MIYPLHGQYPRGFYNGEKKITIFSWESLYTDRVDGLANATTYLAHELAKKHEVNFFTRGIMISLFLELTTMPSDRTEGTLLNIVII